MAPKLKRKIKTTSYRLVELPKHGDCLLLRFQNHPTFRHQVYDDFPSGRKVSADEAFVDFSEPIYVEEVRTANIGQKMYVGVSFVLGPGLELWTNYSKESFRWFVKIRV